MILLTEEEGSKRFFNSVRHKTAEIVGFKLLKIFGNQL